MTRPTFPKDGVWLVCSRIHVLRPVLRASSVVFDVSSDGSGATVIVKIAGEVDLHSVGELKRQLRRVLAESSSRAIVIDLEVLKFLSACGVSALLAAKRCAEQAGRDVQVINAQGSPARALKLLGFESWCKHAAGDDVKVIDEPR